MLNPEFVEKQRLILESKKEKYESFDKKNKPIHAHLKTNNSLLFIKVALERIKKCLYGICVDCDKEILTMRLKSVPGAIRCTSCQKLFDSRRK